MNKKLPALTIFLGSFLIFGVQPMLGRTLLPAFGGTAAVWVVCLATFQMLLLAGYFYAHCVSIEKVKSEKLKVKNERSKPNEAIRQSGNKAIHIALLGLAVVWVAAFAHFRPWLLAQVGNGATPALEVLLCVLAFVGLPYVLLSANSTLIQAWVSQWTVGSGRDDTEGTAGTKGTDEAGRTDVYALYAVSNAGSLLGLLCYPFFVEPFLSLDAQWYGFAGCLALYAGLLAMLARRIALLRYCQIALLEEPQQSEVGEERDEPSTSNVQRSTLNEEKSEDNNAITQSGNKAMLLWLLLPATSTFLLNAVTAHLSTDVTPIPLMWVALLSAFLLSYIIGFSKVGEKGVLVWCVLAMVPLVFCAYALGLKGGRGFIFNLVPGLLLVLLGCTFLHSWLYRVRPDERLLTRYYLCLAAGGAVGGLLSGIVAPLVFNSVLEYPVVLVLAAGMGVLYVMKNVSRELQWTQTLVYIIAVAVLFFTVSGSNKEDEGVTVLHRMRNFYGCLKVSSQQVKSAFGDPVLAYRFQHGETLHGVQFQPHYLREKPTTYFGPNGGGFGIMRHPSYVNGKPMSVGIIGLGIGTLAAYGRTNDTYRFFEINPQVVSAAWNTNQFTYLSGCKASVSVALGDARRVIEAETNRYDVLVIDAYSGDSIPFHLATKEAFKLYLDRLNPGGILAVHISNWHIDLNPLCKAVAKEWGLKMTGVISQAQGVCTPACWVFLGDRPLPVQGLSVRETDWSQVRDIALPTDACGSLVGLVRYGYRTPEKPLELDLSTGH